MIVQLLDTAWWCFLDLVQTWGSQFVVKDVVTVSGHHSSSRGKQNEKPVMGCRHHDDIHIKQHFKSDWLSLQRSALFWPFFAMTQM